MNVNRDTSYSSIWLFEKKKELPYLLSDTIASPIGRGSPTGNNHYSEFNPTVCRKIISFWSEENDLILDPFAGRTRASISSLMNRNYIGFELSKLVYNHLISTFDVYQKSSLLPINCHPILINDDSYNMDKYNLPDCDLVFTCPPYWTLEKYNAGEGDLSTIDDYNSFLMRYSRILKKAVAYLKPLKYMVIVVGDFRKEGNYTAFHSDSINLLREFENIKLHDIICNQSVTFDIANFRFGGFSKNKIVAKVHEYILIYKKVGGHL